MLPKRKELSEAIGAERLLFTARELLPCQRSVASVAGEALAMPRSVLVGNATFVDHPVALDASLSVLFLVARHADDFLVTWYERLRSNRLTTDFAGEALLMILLPFELKLLHPGSKDVVASVASESEVVVMTVGAVSPVVFVGKRPIDQGGLAVDALEARLMPMLVLVRQVLVVGSNWPFAVFALVGKQRLVAFDAEWLFISQDVAISGQVERTVETAQARPL